VQQKVSSRGGIQVCNQRVTVGFTYARKIVTVEVHQTASARRAAERDKAEIARWRPGVAQGIKGGH
jgi:hypothetical protein